MDQGSFESEFHWINQSLTLLCQCKCFKVCLPSVLLAICLLIVIDHTMFISSFLRMIF